MLQPQLKEQLIQSGQFIYAPTNAAEYNALVALLDELTDIVRDDETHPLARAMDVLGVLIADYESATVPEPVGSGIDVLRHLMLEHGLRQQDLPELGTQSVVSEVLSGKRELNIRQIRALSQRFNLSADAFV